MFTELDFSGPPAHGWRMYPTQEYMRHLEDRSDPSELRLEMEAFIAGLTSTLMTENRYTRYADTDNSIFSQRVYVTQALGVRQKSVDELLKMDTYEFKRALEYASYSIIRELLSALHTELLRVPAYKEKPISKARRKSVSIRINAVYKRCKFTVEQLEAR